MLQLPSLPLTDAAAVFAVLFAVILVAPLAAERARMPGILGLIIAGMLIGENGVGLLARPGLVAGLSGAGLLYLMFVAGLDLDLEGFGAHRRDSLVFGAATFFIPMAVNTAVCLVLGFDLLAALLIASAFTSHTLVAYPLVERLGLGRSRAVTATLGATMLSTVAALLVLAVTASAFQGELGIRFWLTFLVVLTTFAAFTMLGLPRITKWFFTGLGQDRHVRFTFVLVVLFAVSSLSEIAGIEAIVGAFLAGLALNRYVPNSSALRERLQTLGSSLLIPLFLIGTGMLIDPRLLVSDAWVVMAGAALTVSALAAKLLAAWPAARYLGAQPGELGVMFSLSSAQAAGALAAAIVANDIGMIGEDTVNAVVLVILGTCLVASASAARYAPRAPRPGRRPNRLGDSIVVPIANPLSAAPLVKLAAYIAGPDSGSVVPVNVLGFEADQDVVDSHRELAEDAEKVALAHGAEAHSIVRIDASPTAGVLHTVVESNATSVLLGWKGFANAREHFFGGVIDTILSRTPVPVFVCRTVGDLAFGQVVLSVGRSDLTPAGLPGLELAVLIARRLSKQADRPLLVVTEDAHAGLDERLAGHRNATVVADPRRADLALRDHTRPDDVIVIGSPPTRATVGHNAERIARVLVDRTLVVVVPRV